MQTVRGGMRFVRYIDAVALWADVVWNATIIMDPYLSLEIQGKVRYNSTQGKGTTEMEVYI